MYVYVSKEEQHIITMSKGPLPYEETEVTEYLTNVPFPTQKEGYRYTTSWDAENEKVVVIEEEIEGYFDSSSEPTQEEVQELILLNTEYLVIMTEINTGE